MSPPQLPPVAALGTVYDGFVGCPAWSPDGRQIAYWAMERPGFEADRCVLWVCDVGGDEAATPVHRELTAATDLSFCSTPLWTADGYTVVVTAQKRGRSSIFHVSGPAGNAFVTQCLPGDCHSRGAVRLVGARGGAEMVFLESSFTGPHELKLGLIAPDGTQEVPAPEAGQLAQERWVSRGEVISLTSANVDGPLKGVGLDRPGEMVFAGARGEEVQAWVLEPRDRVEGRKYATILVIHGGPQGAIVDGWHYRWNLQSYAAQGFGVVAVNFHGSTGFGQAFTDSISGDWGGAPFEDLMAAVDAANARYGWIDADRWGACGASYGGYMINWINGHAPAGKFKCLVNHDGLFDMRAFFFSTEELWFPEWEFGGAPFALKSGAAGGQQTERAASALYQTHNPALFVDKWETPCLVVHGGKDYRVSETEGIGTFTALQRRGIPSRFLYFPGENHWVLNPANSIVWHESVMEWLHAWLSEKEEEEEEEEEEGD